MRHDQIERLKDVAERLADVFIDEADPSFWPEDRTERYKIKRDAAETAMLLSRTQALMECPVIGETGSGEKSPEDKRVETAAKRAEEAVKKAMERKRTA